MKDSNETSPVLQKILIQEWDKQAPLLIQEIAKLENATVNSLLAEKMTVFRNSLHGLSAGEKINFGAFQKECQMIFKDHLPKYKTPHLMTVVGNFFKVWFIATLATFFALLAALLQTEFLAFMGLISVTAIHWQTTISAAAFLGAIVATLSSLSLFSPQSIANDELGKFARKVIEEPASTRAGLF